MSEKMHTEIIKDCMFVVVVVFAVIGVIVIIEMARKGHFSNE